MLDKKEFSSKLAGVIKSQKNMRENVQELLDSGFEQVVHHGNTIYLSTLLRQCIGVRSMPTKALKEYIQAHVSNCAWRKDKDGNMVFMKAVKNKPMEVTVPDVKWYDHASAHKAQAKADVDAVARAKALLTVLSKSIEAGTVKDKEQAEKITAALSAALA